MNYPDHLREIFDRLKNGYHISSEDDLIYATLNGERYDDYVDYFAGLGFKLHKHERDFFYFEPEAEDAGSSRLAKIAVFSFILIDHIANRGLPVEPTLFSEIFTIRGLPHFTLDSYRARLEQAGVMDNGDLRDVIHSLKNVGWAKWVAEDEFQFLRPFHRMLSKCLELAEQSGEAASEINPLQSVGLSTTQNEEGQTNA
ncbi:MAG: condensin complex protein MksE [Limisphaerales bacterium]